MVQKLTNKKSLCFLFQLILLLACLCHLVYHFAKKRCCGSKAMLKHAFIDNGRRRLEDEESIIGSTDVVPAKTFKGSNMDDMAYFVENDYNHLMFKAIASGH